MAARLIFDFPLPENLGNSRMHWATKLRAKKHYWERLDNLVLLKNLPRPPRWPWVKCKARVQLRTWRQMDEDNGHARLKWVLDWLESRGYVENDRWITVNLLATTAPRDAVGITLVLEPEEKVA